MKTLRNFLQEQSGQDVVEYVLLIALIAFGATAAMKGLSTAINNVFANISTTLSSSLPDGGRK